VQNPMKTSWFDFRSAVSLAGRYVLVFAVILFISAVLLGPIWQTNSAIVDRQMVSATIKSVSRIPQHYRTAGPVHLKYTYMIVLDTGAIALVKDSAARPHSIGSPIRVERRTRENGVATYHVNSTDP
jgi:hypothetical protein